MSLELQATVAKAVDILPTAGRFVLYYDYLKIPDSESSDLKGQECLKKISLSVRDQNTTEEIAECLIKSPIEVQEEHLGLGRTYFHHAPGNYCLELYRTWVGDQTNLEALKLYETYLKELIRLMYDEAVKAKQDIVMMLKNGEIQTTSMGPF